MWQFEAWTSLFGSRLAEWPNAGHRCLAYQRQIGSKVNTSAYHRFNEVMNIEVSRGEIFTIIVLNACRMLARLREASRDNLEIDYPKIIMQKIFQHPWSRSQTGNLTCDGLRP